MRIIGLTGGIGAGKSEAAKILKRRGAYIIAADKIGHSLLVPQSGVWCGIVKAFGSKILMSGGKINRKKLAQVVFSDKKMLHTLNHLMHAEIVKKIKEEITGSRSDLVVIDAALPELFKGIAKEIWVITSSKENRVKRLLKAGLKKDEIQKRIKSQMPQKEYLNLADKVIRNDGSIKSLKERIVHASSTIPLIPRTR